MKWNHSQKCGRKDSIVITFSNEMIFHSFDSILLCPSLSPSSSFSVAQSEKPFNLNARILYTITRTKKPETENKTKVMSRRWCIINFICLCFTSSTGCGVFVHAHNPPICNQNANENAVHRLHFDASSFVPSQSKHRADVRVSRFFLSTNSRRVR